MPTQTYTPIARQVLASSTTTITFNSFSGYTDLRLVVTPFSTADGMNYMFRFNGDTASNYSFTGIRGNGSAVTSGRVTDTFFNNLNMGVYTTTPHTYLYDIFNYANATTFKTILARFSETGGTGFTAASVGLWRKTPESVTSITLTAITNQFASGSTFTLYGIKAGS
jgi:hypothetical protein